MVYQLGSYQVRLLDIPSYQHYSQWIVPVGDTLLQQLLTYNVLVFSRGFNNSNNISLLLTSAGTKRVTGILECT